MSGVANIVEYEMMGCPNFRESIPGGHWPKNIRVWYVVRKVKFLLR